MSTGAKSEFSSSATSIASQLPGLLVTVVSYTIMISLEYSSAAPVSSVSNDRWLYPCSGTESMFFIPKETETETVQTTPSAQTKSNMASTFHVLSTKVAKLKRRVRDLKNSYVRERFRDDSIVEDLEQMGIRLDGMPVVHHPTIMTISTADVISTIHTAFEHLARVAVFLDQARIGENMATNEHISFEKDFQRIQDHHEDGLYWIMCALHQVIHRTGTKMDADVINDVMNMRVTEVDRNAMRHTRDYLVLRDFERILDRLSIDFASLRKLHSS